jgi:hypothetical protein
VRRYRVYGRRAMLNLPGFETTGAVVAELVEQDKYWDATLNISDCSRSVVLSIFDPASADTSDLRFDNDLYKVDTLIECLKEFRKGMLRVRRLRRA